MARRALKTVLPALAVSKLLTLGPLAAISIISVHGVDVADMARRLHFWDAQSYLSIAQDGYPATTEGSKAYLEAFFPGFPMLIAFVSKSGTPWELSGLIVNTVAQGVGLIYVYRLVAAERNDRTATFSVWAVALAPLGTFWTVIYTESLFLAGTAACLFYARRGNFAAAALGAFVAGTARITGAVLVVPMLWEWTRQKKKGGPNWTTLPLVLSAVVPAVLFMGYLGIHTGDYHAFFKAEASPSFNHTLSWPWQGFNTTWGTVTNPGVSPDTVQIFLREVVAALIGLLACILAWIDRRFPASLAAYCTLIWLSATALNFWLSIPRYLLAMFPFIIIVVDATRGDRWLRPAFVFLCAGIMTWASVIYATGAWLA